MTQTVRWHCSARDCSGRSDPNAGHADRDETCDPPYLCRRVWPPCGRAPDAPETTPLGHGVHGQACQHFVGAKWHCSARDCPGRTVPASGHSHPDHICERPPYICNRVLPQCDTHGRAAGPASICRGDLLAFHEDAASCTSETQPPGHVVGDCPHCRFDVAIELRSHTDDTRLTPLKIPSHSELGGSSSANRDYARFVIEVEFNSIQEMSVRILRGTGGSTTTVYAETLDPGTYTVGEHEWEWDGFDSSDILDTRVLKDPSLKLELTAELCGETKIRTLEFSNSPAQVDWIDVTIDRGTSQVEVEMRLELPDGGDSGVGESPPAGARTTTAYLSASATDPERTTHTRLQSYTDLKDLVIEGIQKYWSRNSTRGYSINTYSGSYELSVTAVETNSESMHPLDIFYNTNSTITLSSNWGPGGVLADGVSDALDLLWITAFTGRVEITDIIGGNHIAYNTGWLNYNNMRRFLSTGDTDVLTTEDWHFKSENAYRIEDFRRTAAHEIGHDVVLEYAGLQETLTHHGTSSLAQTKLSVADGGENCPTTGEIDLMKYYNYTSGYRPANFHARSVANEVDAAALVWLARVEFNVE